MAERGSTRLPRRSGSVGPRSSGQREADRFQLLFEQAAIGLEQLDLEGRLINANATVCAMLGYEREDLIGRNFADLTHPNDLAHEQGMLSRLLAGEVSSYRCE